MCIKEHSFLLVVMRNLEAYKSYLDPGQAAVRVRAYQVRSLGTFLLFKGNIAVQQVMTAGKWISQIMFTSPYLRGVTHGSMDTFPIGPVVAT